MSDPIRTQIDSLSAQLASQHTELMGALGDLTSAISPAPDYTTAFADLSTKLTTISGTLTVSRASLSAIQNNTGNAYSTLLDIFSRLGDMSTYLANVDSATNAMLTSLGLAESGDYPSLQYKLAAILTYIANISSNTQGIASSWPQDVLNGLECICDAANRALPLDPTDPSLPGYCSEPTVSTGQVILPWTLIGGTSQMFAVFDVLPPGLSYGSTFSLADDHTELDATDWTGWRVFVQSDQPQYADGADLLGVARYPTNQWNALDGTNPRAFSIDARGSIKVYLCSPDAEGAPDIAPGTCHDFSPTGTNGDAYTFDIPNYPTNYTIRVNQPANITDSLSNTHFVNYGIDWTQEDVGPGPWYVEMGDNRFFPASAYTVTVCNPEV